MQSLLLKNLEALIQIFTNFGYFGWISVPTYIKREKNVKYITSGFINVVFAFVNSGAGLYI